MDYLMCGIVWFVAVLTFILLWRTEIGGEYPANIFKTVKILILGIFLIYFPYAIYRFHRSHEYPSKLELYLFVGSGGIIIFLSILKISVYFYYSMIHNHDEAIKRFYESGMFKNKFSAPTRSNIENTINAYIRGTINSTILSQERGFYEIRNVFNVRLLEVRRFLAGSLITGIPLIWISFTMITFGGNNLNWWEIKQNNIKPINVTKERGSSQEEKKEFISINDAAYFVSQTMATLGMGDVLPFNKKGSWSCVFVMIMIATSLFYLSGSITIVVSTLFVIDSYVDDTITNFLNLLEIQDRYSSKR